MQKRQAAEVIGTVQEQSKQYVLSDKLLRLGNNNIVCLGIARNFFAAGILKSLKLLLIY